MLLQGEQYNYIIVIVIDQETECFVIVQERSPMSTSLELANFLVRIFGGFCSYPAHLFYLLMKRSH